MIILASLFSVSLLAQKVTLRFENATNRNYEVKVDGKSYYSTDVSSETGVNRQRAITITDLQTGTHTMDVSALNTSNTKTSIYSNTFQLREGYDMVIAIRRNDQVTFTEKQSIKNNGSLAQSPMTDAEFTKLQTSISSKWSQSARLTTAKAAVNVKTNYFTTEQVGLLLSLITADAKKVELAKLSYPKVTDPDNFSEINTLFTSQASRDEMERYIGSNPNSGTIATTNDPYNTRPVMASNQFNILLQTVKNQYSQQGKMDVLTDAFATPQYYSTAQLRQLISQVTDENNRLSLSKLSYAKVSDPANFSTLYNLLSKQSSRDELIYFVKYGGNTAVTGQYANRIAMPDDEFRKLYQKAALHFRQSSVVSDVKIAFTNTTKYYSIAQIRELLGLVAVESDRLAIAKLAYHRVTEPPAFTQLLDMFTTEASKNDLSNYINSVARNQ